MHTFFSRLAAVFIAVCFLTADVGAMYVVDDTGPTHSALHSISGNSPTFCLDSAAPLTMLGLAYEKRYLELKQYRVEKLESGDCFTLLARPKAGTSSPVKTLKRRDDGSPITIEAVLTIGRWLDRKTGEISIGSGYVAGWAGRNDGGYF